MKKIIKLVLLLFATTSCGSIECMYSDAYWGAHLIHFEENMTMVDCHWCREYNKQIP